MNIVLKISNILIGTDGTEFSLKAFHFSKDLACIYNSLITAFTAFNTPDKYKTLEKEKEDYNTLSFEKEIQRSKTLLLDISRKTIEEGINLNTKFYGTEATPDLAMIEFAESEGVNYI